MKRSIKSRRGGTQKMTPNPVPLADAKRLAPKILKEKLGKGHRSDEAPAPIQRAPTSPAPA
jgi:hypothetical protein